MDTVHQTRAVELLITHAATLFGATKHTPECDHTQMQQEELGQVDLPGFIPEQHAKEPLSSPDYDPSSSQGENWGLLVLKNFRTEASESDKGRGLISYMDTFLTFNI
jgi:hypothetical protein